MRVLVPLLAIGTLLGQVTFGWCAYAGPIKKERISEIRASLKGKTVTLRVSPNRAKTLYAPGDPAPGYVLYASGSFLPPTTPTRVVVLDVEGDSHDIKIVLRHGSQGKGKLILSPSMPGAFLEPDAVDALIALVIATDNYNHDGDYILNTRSGVVHARGANHLPSLGDQKALVTLTDIQRLHLCGACFRPNPRVSDYDTEAYLGRVWASQVRSVYPTVVEDEESARLTRAGQRVLQNWPIPLRGYDYKFTLVRSDEPNALACPAGEIFVTTGLIQTIDDESELDAALAHEIAHVERRHGYRQFKRARRAGLIGSILAGAVAVTTNDSKLTTAAVLMSQLAAAVVLAGYSQAEEDEADSYALTSLGSIGETKARDSQRLLLSKLQFWATVVGKPDFEANEFRSHPLIQNRK